MFRVYHSCPLLVGHVKCLHNWELLGVDSDAVVTSLFNAQQYRAYQMIIGGDTNNPQRLTLCALGIKIVCLISGAQRVSIIAVIRWLSPNAYMTARSPLNYIQRRRNERWHISRLLIKQQSSLLIYQ